MDTNWENQDNEVTDYLSGELTEEDQAKVEEVMAVSWRLRSKLNSFATIIARMEGATPAVHGEAYHKELVRRSVDKLVNEDPTVPTVLKSHLQQWLVSWAQGMRWTFQTEALTAASTVHVEGEMPPQCLISLTLLQSAVKIRLRETVKLTIRLAGWSTAPVIVVTAVDLKGRCSTYQASPLTQTAHAAAQFEVCVGLLQAGLYLVVTDLAGQTLMPAAPQVKLNESLRVEPVRWPVGEEPVAIARQRDENLRTSRRLHSAINVLFKNPLRAATLGVAASLLCAILLWRNLPEHVPPASDKQHAQIPSAKSGTKIGDADTDKRARPRLAFFLLPGSRGSQDSNTISIPEGRFTLALEFRKESSDLNDEVALIETPEGEPVWGGLILKNAGRSQAAIELDSELLPPGDYTIQLIQKKQSTWRMMNAGYSFTIVP